MLENSTRSLMKEMQTTRPSNKNNITYENNAELSHNNKHKGGTKSGNANFIS